MGTLQSPSSAQESACLDPTIEGTRGNDVLVGGVGPDVIAGFDGNDRIDGKAGDDVICGDSGNDRLLGETGDDSLFGGAGLDTADFSAAGNAVSADLEAGSASGDGSDALEEIEVVIGTNFDDELIGDQLTNFLNGGLGSDTLDGAAGFDFAVFFQKRDEDIAVRVDLAAGTAHGQGNDVVDAIEGLVGSAEQDVLIGNLEANILVGGDDGDELHGSDGDDMFFTERVGLTKLPAPGITPSPNPSASPLPPIYDRVYGGEGEADLLDYSLYDAPYSLRADLSSGFITHRFGPSRRDLVQDVEWLRGSPGPDFIIGTEGINLLVGFAGDDELLGSEGNDFLSGGQGRDRVDGQVGDDTCIGGQVTVGCENDGQPWLHRLEAFRSLWTKLRFE